MSPSSFGKIRRGTPLSVVNALHKIQLEVTAIREAQAREVSKPFLAFLAGCLAFRYGHETPFAGMGT